MNVGDALLLSTTGSVLPQELMATLQSSLPTLRSARGFLSAKLWGRISGTEADCLIAMGEEHMGKMEYFYRCAARRHGHVMPVRAGRSASAVTAAWLLCRGARGTVPVASYAIGTEPQALCAAEACRSPSPGDAPPGDALTPLSTARLSRVPRSTDGASWMLLEPPTEGAAQLCALLPAGTPFTGVPSSTLTMLTAPEDPLPESARLFFLVQTVQAECALCPAASRAPGSVRPNPHFSGISQEAAMDLSSYVLLGCKAPSSALSDSATDALATADSVVPTGSLSCSYDEASKTVVVRNLSWLGFYAYVQPGTPTYGYCYFGNGLKNPDTAFMLH